MAFHYCNRRMIVGTAMGWLLTGCDKAVSEHQSVSYRIKGNPQSILYPLAVKWDGEDVRIHLKAAAPVPEIVSIDTAGRVIAFNFMQAGQTLVVPEKFDHLQMRLEGAGAIDIELSTAAAEK